MRIKIGIDFGDNDFYHLFEGFFNNIILELYFTPTKEQVVELFNSSAYGMYLAFQNKFTYGEKEHNKYLAESYLKITTDKVYINEEVQEYLDDPDQAHFKNGEFFYTDGRKFLNA